MKENGKAAIQRDLARLEEWANRRLMKFSEDKCKVLHLGRKKPWHKYKMVMPSGDAACQRVAQASISPRARELEPRMTQFQHSPCPQSMGLVMGSIDNLQHGK